MKYSGINNELHPVKRKWRVIEVHLATAGQQKPQTCQHRVDWSCKDIFCERKIRKQTGAENPR
jgi:hypothetical protein